MTQDIDISVQPFDGSFEAFADLAKEFYSSHSIYRGYEKLLALAHTYDVQDYRLFSATLDGATAGLAAVRSKENFIYFDIFVVRDEFRGVGVGDILFDALVRREEFSEAQYYESMSLPGDRSTKNFFEQRKGKARLLIVNGEITRD